MGRITALIRLSAAQYLGRWRAAFALRPGLVLFEGAAMAWLALRYLRFLGHVSNSLVSQAAKSWVSLVLLILGCLAAAPILAMMHPARENPRWRLLPLNRKDRIFTSGFQYVFQFPFILLVFAIASTAWVCRQGVDPAIWFFWAAVSTAFWAAAVRAVCRRFNLVGGVLIASVSVGLSAAFASSTVVNRTIVGLSSHPEGWQRRFWSIAAGTLVVTLVILGGGEALWRFIPFLRARSDLRWRSRRVGDRHYLAIWLRHIWHRWSGCLHPYLAIMFSAPFLYYLCWESRPSVIAAFAASGFLALIVGAPLLNIFGRESCAGLDRFAIMPMSGRRILDLENSGVLLGNISFLLLTTLLIGARFGVRAASASGLVSVAVIFGLLALGGFGSILWPRRIHRYRGGGAGSLSLAFSLLLIWAVPTIFGVLYAEGKLELLPLLLLAAFYATLYWLCRPRIGTLLSTRLWTIRSRLRREEF